MNILILPESIPINEMGEHVGLLYVSHSRVAKAQTSLRHCIAQARQSYCFSHTERKEVDTCKARTHLYMY